MAEKKAKVENFNISQFVADNAWLSTFDAIEKAYNTGVSEQEAVLDKIRGEIEQMDFDFGDFHDHTSTIREMVLEVIDKYKGGRK